MQKEDFHFKIGFEKRRNLTKKAQNINQAAKSPTFPVNLISL
jgi:hypothetical protein